MANRRQALTDEFRARTDLNRSLFQPTCSCRGGVGLPMPLSRRSRLAIQIRWNLNRDKKSGLCYARPTTDNARELFVGGRYNSAEGELVGMTQKVGADRSQFGAGWYLTPTLLLKGEWVNQKYRDFPTTDIRNGGRFKGFMVEGVVAF